LYERNVKLGDDDESEEVLEDEEVGADDSDAGSAPEDLGSGLEGD
tara:strand:- start:2321 stop:2455 length:135 start_codon:yes stop_codon:yes gene_type:complete